MLALAGCNGSPATDDTTDPCVPTRPSEVIEVLHGPASALYGSSATYEPSVRSLNSTHMKKASMEMYANAIGYVVFVRFSFLQHVEELMNWRLQDRSRGMWLQVPLSDGV